LKEKRYKKDKGEREEKGRRKVIRFAYMKKK
jgi:hypothetical protein